MAGEELKETSWGGAGAGANIWGEGGEMMGGAGVVGFVELGRGVHASSSNPFKIAGAGTALGAGGGEGDRGEMMGGVSFRES